MALPTSPTAVSPATVAAATAPTALPTVPSSCDPDIPDVAIYRLSVAQYHAMAREGILLDGEPVELLEGLLVRKMTMNPAHCLSLGLVQDVLLDLLPKGWHLKIQGATTTSESEPKPDVTLVRGRRRDYLRRHPSAADIGLVIEVADSSLAYDRGTKQRIYARAGITVYWIVNLIERQVEVYTDPTGPADEPTYRHQQNYGEADVVPVVLDGEAIGQLNVGDLLP